MKYSSSIFGDEIVNGIDDIPVIEGYSCDPGAYLRIIEESCINETMCFEESMGYEFNEVAALLKAKALENQGMFEEAANIEVVTEGASEVVDKLVAIVRKAWQKIISLYEAVKTKIQALFNRDINAFYKKHKATFDKYASAYKGKYKFKVPKHSIDFSVLKAGSFNNSSSRKINEIMATDGDELTKLEEKVSSGDLLEEVLGIYIKGSGTVTRGEVKKELYETMFEDKDTFEDAVPDKIVKAVDEILSVSNVVKNLEKAKKANNDYFKKLLAEIKGFKNKAKDLKDGGEGRMEFKTATKASTRVYHSDKKNLVQKQLTVLSKTISVYQTANNLVNGAYIGLIKMHIAQCKGLFTRVVGFGRGKEKGAKYEQALLDGIHESAAFEVMDALDTVEVLG